jgi:hypothetical protein
LAIELIVSVQTHLLDKDPTLTVESRLPHGASNSANNWCVIQQLSESLQYAELVHPDDLCGFEIKQLKSGDGSQTWTHRLFPRHIEKGVILRSRLRGLFYPGETSLSEVVAAYRNFAASPPPLTA